MKPNVIQIRKSINKAFLKVKPNRSQIESFKTNIINLYDQINEVESEEFHKNIISKFLNDTYYSPNHYINTKGRTDLVVHNGKDASSSVGILIEAKKPSNKAEMPTIKKLNAKALQELILYYLRERITLKNLEVKQLVITNIYEWFIFDATEFDKHFAQNKKFVKQFTDFEEGRLSGTNTDFFYKQIAEPFIDSLDIDMNFTYLDIRAFERLIRNNDKLDDNKLVALYKLFSPENLLKQPFVNDSNSLDKRFYSELLHIIGLQENKEGSKKVINRLPVNERNSGSLVENTILILDSEDCLSDVKKSDYGETKDEQLYNVALELVITWINRVLFLKLLEGQLIKYHAGDNSYKFLDFEKIPDYDALNKLFFQVLAIKEDERNDLVKSKYSKIPYLNSSLFEPNTLEHKTIKVSNLEDEYSLPLLSSTVIKDETGKKRSGELNALEYFFSFLDAYDFASEGSEAVQEENKTLINASVLGLIFEKINGYKDGSFFTPGFITMYMCRETIRRAVIQKFNETKNWSCKTIDDLYDKIEDRTEANTIINDLKICDPAVGSGHFLVSALNEIVAIKNDLKILSDRDGKRLKEYTVEVVNDELVITDEEGELFEYNPRTKESQRIQETLFHEKQTIIENCLFGVDINPNSVKICRLRLWIELLKNAYYKSETEELETLPNIDINIKCGNSLISRYSLDADIKKALRNSKWDINSYRLAVMSYRNAKSKDEKRSMEKLISEIKSDFESEIASNDKRLIKLNKLKGEMLSLTNQTSMFELSKKEKTEWNKKVKKVTTEKDKLETALEEIKSNKIYENAFEWRFEFPEVLNDDGEFIGFDVIIGNPPYVFARDNFTQEHKNYYYDNYKGIDYQVNLYVLFAELTLNILRNTGNYSLIVPNALLMVSSTVKIRKLLFTNAVITEIINFIGESFEGVNVETVSFFGHKNVTEKSIKIGIGGKGDIVHVYNKDITRILNNEELTLNVFSTDSEDQFIDKISINCKVLDEISQIKAGLKAYQKGKGKPKQTADIVKNRPFDYNYKYDDDTFPYLEGRDIARYAINWSGGYLRFGSFLAEPRKFLGDKIIIREITNNSKYALNCTFTNDDYLFNMSNIAILPLTDSYNIKYILALLNSSLISFFFVKMTAKSVRKMFPKIILKDLRKFPIKDIPVESQLPYINLVNQILEIKQENPFADTTKIETEIDQLVYQLYGLNEEEIAFVEEINT